MEMKPYGVALGQTSSQTDGEARHGMAWLGMADTQDLKSGWHKNSPLILYLLAWFSLVHSCRGMIWLLMLMYVMLPAAGDGVLKWELSQWINREPAWHLADCRRVRFLNRLRCLNDSTLIKILWLCILSNRAVLKCAEHFFLLWQHKAQQEFPYHHQL